MDNRRVCKNSLDFVISISNVFHDTFVIMSSSQPYIMGKQGRKEKRKKKKKEKGKEGKKTPVHVFNFFLLFNTRTKVIVLLSLLL